MGPFEIAIGTTKLLYGSYRELTVRDRVVNSAIRALSTVSFSKLPLERRRKIEHALRKWTKTEDFIDYWKDSLLKGNFDRNEAYQSFSKSTLTFSAIAGVSIKEVAMPHFLQHLQAHRWDQDREFRAYCASSHHHESNEFDQSLPVIADNSRDIRVAISGTSEEQACYAVIKKAEDLADRGRLKHACDLLTSFRDEKSFLQLGIKTRFSLHKCLGLIALKSNLFASALENFQIAVSMKRNDIETISYLSQTHLQLGNNENALDLAEQAISLDNRNAIAAATFILAYGLANKHENLFEKLNQNPQWLTSKFVLGALGHIAGIEHDYPLAEKFYRDARSLEPDDLSYNFAIVACKLIQLQKGEILLSSGYSHRNSDDRFDTAQLIEMLEELLNYNRASDLPSNGIKYIQALIAVHGLRNDWDKALNAIDTWHTEDQASDLNVLKLQILIQLDRDDEALALLKTIEPRTRNIVISHYLLERKKGDTTKCLELIEEVDSYPGTPLGHIINKSLRAQLLFTAGKKEHCNSIIDEIVLLQEEEEIAKAEVYALRRLFGISQELGKEVPGEASNHEASDKCRQRAASLLIENNQWLSAADELRRLSDIEENAENLEWLIRVQWSAGLHFAASRNAIKLRHLTGSIVEGITDIIEISGYLMRKEWSEGLKLASVLQEAYPENPDYIAIEALITCYGLKNKQLAKTIADAIDCVNLSRNIHHQLLEAHLVKPKPVLNVLP